MNCEKFFSHWESSSLWRRWRARRHAQHCPSCMAAITMLTRWKEEMARSEPLTSRQRGLWQQATLSTNAIPVFGLTRGQLALAATVVVLIAVVTVVSMNGNRLPIRNPGPQPFAGGHRTVEVARIDSRPALAELEIGLVRLEEEIAELSKAAELAVAREQVVVLIDTYNQW